MIQNSYNDAENIIYTIRSGKVDVSEILSNIITISVTFNHLDRLYILEDIRNSNTHFNHKDYISFISLIKQKIDRFKKVKVALVVNKPKDTALSMLYELAAKEIENYTYKTFSNIEIAKNWLKEKSKTYI